MVHQQCCGKSGIHLPGARTGGDYGSSLNDAGSKNHTLNLGYRCRLEPRFDRRDFLRDPDQRNRPRPLLLRGRLMKSNGQHTTQNEKNLTYLLANSFAQCARIIAHSALHGHREDDRAD